MQERGASQGAAILICVLRVCVRQYDLSASTYSPEGRIFQVEYAGKAVEKSGYVRLRCSLSAACFAY